MVSATKASVTTTYALSALGQRVKKTTAGSSTYFVYDDAGHLVGEYDNAGNLVQETVWFGDSPVATLRPSGGGVDVFYVHTDHLNTPRRVSRPSDNVVVWRWDSDPFGTAATNEDPDGDSNLFSYSLRFPGQYLDSETGLHYNHFRDYDSATGSYAQSDSFGLVDGINTYAYVASNPIYYADAMGLVKIPGIPGAEGETSVHANPGPEATDYRPEHGPDHVHLGKNDGPRVRTSDFKPLSEADAKRMTRKQKQFCERLSEESKDLIRKKQNQIFKYGRILASLQAGGLLSISAACRADPGWCLDRIEEGALP